MPGRRSWTGLRPSDDREDTGHLAHAAVQAAADVVLARGRDREPDRRMEARLAGRPAVSLESGYACSRDGRDGRGRDLDPADALVPGVGDVEVAAWAGFERARTRERRERGGAAVPAEAGRSGAGHGRDDPGRARDAANDVVPGVGHVEVSVGSECDVLGRAKPGRRSGTAVAA